MIKIRLTTVKSFKIVAKALSKMFLESRILEPVMAIAV